MVIPFVGREREVLQLREHFDAACARHQDGDQGPRFVLLAAESGVGKSRLVQQLYHQLTTDPHWDPPEVDYWPDAFGGSGEEVRVNPDLQGHDRGGPARFLWLGVSWSAPGERKAASDRSLTALKDVLELHIKIRDRYYSSLSPLKSLAEEGLTELAESVVPGVGVARRAVGVARKLWGNIKQRDRSFDEESESQSLDVTQLLISGFQRVLEGQDSIPVVLWLDDAHWIDEQSAKFLQRLWQVSCERRWPLLVVATHWEREWREGCLHAQDEGETRAAGLHACRGPGFNEWFLDGVRDQTLRAIAAAACPGLSRESLDLIVDKACSNCLAMVENLGELKQMARNFEGGDFSADLSPAGRRRAEGWAKDRSRRAQQRFMTIGDQLQDLLGWSSRLGQRFLSDVVTEFAGSKLDVSDTEALLERCVDPFAILSKPSKLTREFRDKAFHHVAKVHFDGYCKEDEHALAVVLQKHLVAWINDSFRADGEFAGGNGGAAEASAAALWASGKSSELRDLLDMARAELPLTTPLSSGDAKQLAGFRARAIAIVNDAEEHLWERARQLVDELEGVGWGMLPVRVLGLDGRAQLAAACSFVGKHRLAVGLYLSVVEWLEDFCGPRLPAFLLEQKQRLLEAMTALSGELLEVGELGDAIKYSDGALKQARQLEQELGTDESRESLAMALILVSRLDYEQTDYETARDRLEEALAIRRELAQRSTAPAFQRRYAESLLLLSNVWTWAWQDQKKGGPNGQSGRPDGRPDKLLEEALEIARKMVAQRPTPANWRGLARALDAVGDEHRDLGKYTHALRCFEEGLEIQRQQDAVNSTPDTRRALARSLVRNGEVLSKPGAKPVDVESPGRACAETHQNAVSDHAGALHCFEEALAIRQDLSRLLETPESLREHAEVQEHLGRVHHECGDLAQASSCYQGALKISAKVRATIVSRRSQSDVERLQRLVTELEDHDGAISKRLVLEQLWDELCQRRGRIIEGRDPVRIMNPTLSLLDTAPGEARPLGGAPKAAKNRDDLRELPGVYEGAGDTAEALGQAGRYEEAAEFEYARGEAGAALGLLQRASALRARALKRSPVARGRKALICVLYALGKLQSEVGDQENAGDSYLSALRLAKEWLSVSGSASSLRVVAILLSRLGDVDLASHVPEAALKRYRQSLKMLLALRDNLATPECHQDVSLLMEQIGCVKRSSGDLDGAIEWFKKAFHASPDFC